MYMDCYSIDDEYDAEVRKAHLTKDFCSIDDEYDAKVRTPKRTQDAKKGRK